MIMDAQSDLLIVGGGLGGVAAALAACRLGRRVILTERTHWLGGQLTTQGVPPDESRWVEGDHTAASYRELRERIRDHYRRNYPLTDTALADAALNPGRGFVSKLCHEPRVAAVVLAEMASVHQAQGLLDIWYGHEPVAATREAERITAVTLRDDRDGVERRVTADFVVDATELGDLLELGGIDHVIGAESRAETGELHAPEDADPYDQQAISWCFAVEYCPGENHVISRPAGYDHWRETLDPRWPGSQLSWTDVNPITLAERVRPIFTGSPEESMAGQEHDLWHYRRILGRQTFDEQFTGGEVSLVNWPQLDYWEKPLLLVDAAEREAALQGSRDLSLSFLYWMQTEAPRTDGGQGYPELKLRGDVLGSADGLALEPYIREARRIRAEFTVTEAHIGWEMRGPGAGSELFDDSVGIGHYRIDLHPSTNGRNYVDIGCYPFQIPLGALIPQGMDNFLPANKNIGTTHISNGAYRLHPVEWSIGEAVGALTAYCLTHDVTPRHVRSTTEHLRAYQRVLSDELGVHLAWPDEIRCWDGTPEA